MDRSAGTLARRAGGASLRLVAAAGLGIAACSSPPPRAEAPTDGFTTGLVTLTDPTRDPASHLPTVEADPEQPLAPPADMAAWAEQAALDLQRLLDERKEARSEPSTVEPPAPPTASNSPALTPAIDPSAAEPPPAIVVQEPTPTVIPVPVAESDVPLEQRIHVAAASLVSLLRERAAGSNTPVRDYLALAALEAIRPGIASDPATGGMVVGDTLLLPSEWRAVQAVRDMLTKAVTEAETPGDPDKLADLLEEAAAQLNEQRPLRIAAAALCSRVTGYGQYVPFEPARFVAGRPQRLIVYTEVEHFRNRPVRESDRRAVSAGAASAGDRWAIELSQELNLFRDTESQLVLRRPEQTVIETSRNRRREFFLVHEVLLPQTLTVGRYRLKITMRDKTSGAVDEVILPIDVVADPALAAETPRVGFD